LSAVWGGCYMPILDINEHIDVLKRRARQYDVDSLYADTTEGHVGELLQEPGYRRHPVSGR
jgi:hypothetical protein